MPLFWSFTDVLDGGDDLVGLADSLRRRHAVASQLPPSLTRLTSLRVG
jgi:hypothetical protein